MSNFDETDFSSLLQDALTSSVNYLELEYEYKAKAMKLLQMADSYKHLATLNTTDAAYFTDVANQLDLYVTEYNKYINNAQTWQTYYNDKANEYLNKASSLQTGTQADFYSNIADKYTSYANTTVNLANQYYSQDLVYEYSSITSYENIVEQAKRSFQTALNYAKKSEQMDSYDASEAYGQIDGDSNYKYFYKVLAQDSFNRVTSYLSGNGLITLNEYASNGVLNNTTTGYEYQDNIRSLDFEYDISYNVTSRIDTKLNVSQNYTYDQHNRIQTVDTFYNNTLSTTNYTYDNVGNMTYNSDIGSYTYTKAHQVKTAGNRAYTYDANGNMIVNNGKTIEYTVSNKPAKLGDVEFFYNANDDRYKRTEGNKTTHYIGKTYEKDISSNTHRYFIYANGKVVAIYDSTYKSIYLHYDALNSVDTITDTQGTVVQRKAYSAFGKEITTDAFFPYSTKRGYTGHEHIDDSLIHMNGRVYDSAIGRFISADPLIQAPYDTQSYNRYSYVKNNPLNYTDPSGFSWLSKAWKKVVKTVKKYKKVIIAIAAAAITGGAAMTAMGGGFWGAVVGGAVGGFTSGAIITGSLSGAMKGAVFGGISGGVAFGVAEMTSGVFGLSSETAHASSYFSGGNYGAATFKALAHGITRSLITKAQGGRYSSGFWSGFASSGFAAKESWGMGYGTISTAIMSGTVSKISGGKFSNGATTGAFVHMFNSMASMAFGTGSKAATKAGTKKGAEEAGLNKSTTNILAQGAVGTTGGAIAGFAVAGPIGIIPGAILGSSGGLVTGMALESAGIYDFLAENIQKVKTYLNRRMETYFEN